MREIKFRAWDKEGEEMVLSNEIFEVLISMDNKVFAMVKNNDNSIGEIDRSNTVIMQYTGLKDKNGIEIYERDIVWDDHKEEYGLVVFESGEYLCEWETHADSLCNELDYIEVIGNIYEHKYLLEASENENK